jgi:hypothetical protein
MPNQKNRNTDFRVRTLHYIFFRLLLTRYSVPIISDTNDKKFSL